MSEKDPTRITRGIEIQKEKAQELQTKATERYKALSNLSRELDEAIDQALSDPVAKENLDRLAELFNKKRELGKIGESIEDLILRGLDHQDELRDRWAHIERRFAEVTRDEE